MVDLNHSPLVSPLPHPPHRATTPPHHSFTIPNGSLFSAAEVELDQPRELDLVGALQLVDLYPLLRARGAARRWSKSTSELAAALGTGTPPARAYPTRPTRASPACARLTLYKRKRGIERSQCADKSVIVSAIACTYWEQQHTKKR